MYWRPNRAGLRIRSFRAAAVLCLVLGAALAQQNAAFRRASNEAGDRPRYLLRGVSSGLLFIDVNRNDARAAIKVWYDVLARKQGFVLDSTVDILDSVAAIRERLLSHSAEVVTMAVSDYLELEGSGLMNPVMTDARSGQSAAPYSYLLLCNPSSDTTTLAGLRGKNILVCSRSGSNTGLAWIEVLLNKEKLGRAGAFFNSVKTTEKSQACILPLFFGKVDACIVDEVNLDLAKEMNPQLGRLKVITRSRPLIESVVGVPVEPHPHQKELIDAMLSLQEDALGRQLLMVFKTGRLVPLRPGDLDSARELWRDYSRLSGTQPSHPQGTLPAAALTRTDHGRERD